MKTLFEIVTENLNGCTFVSIDAETTVKLKKNSDFGGPNPHYNRIVKQMIGANVMLAQYKNTNAYENMVNRRLEKEGKRPCFTVGPRMWGERIPNTPFITHNDTLYLEMLFMNPGTTVHLFDGVPISPEEFDGKPVSRPPNKLGQGGVKDQVFVRTFKVDAIKKLVMNGKVYVAGVDFIAQ